MVGCSAPNCSNRAAKGGYKMKRFPADPAIRQIWINNVRRADWNWNPPANFRNCRLCEVHFDEEQFEYKSPDGSYRRFKPGAIPTVFNVNPGPEGQSGIPSFGAYCSRRRKKIVGNYDPSLCASNQLNQQLSSLHKSPNNAGETSHSSTSQEQLEPLMDRRNPKGNLPSSTLSVASYMTDHSDFSHPSSQIQYNYHKRFEDNRAPMSLAFHGREVDTIHLPNIPISTGERFNIFSSVATSSRTSAISDMELTVDNVQTMLEPGEIKLEYIADSPASENEVLPDQSTSVKTLLAQKHSEENIQATRLQEMPQIIIHEKFKTLPSNLQPLISMTHGDQENLTQPTPDLPQNIKVDYDFPISASDSGLKPHYAEPTTKHIQSTSKILMPTSTLSVTPSMSVPIKKDPMFLPNSSESSHEEGFQRLISIEKSRIREKSQTPMLQQDATSNTSSKHPTTDIPISSCSQFSTSSNEKSHVLTKRNVLLKSIQQQQQQQQSEHEHSTEEQSDIEILDVDPSSQSMSNSVSCSVEPVRQSIRQNALKKDRATCGKTKFQTKHFLADHLQKKLNEEKRKSRKLRLENQKLRKQLGPLRSLHHWITKFMGTDQIKQLGNFETKETKFKTLQKALKMCSLMCGYLSTVVNFPLYSTQTRPV